MLIFVEIQEDTFFKNFKWPTHLRLPYPNAGGISFCPYKFIAKPLEKHKHI